MNLRLAFQMRSPNGRVLVLVPHSFTHSSALQDLLDLTFFIFTLVLQKAGKQRSNEACTS